MLQPTTEMMGAASPLPPGPREKRPFPALVRRPPAARVALLHGAYLARSGAWPLVHLKSFKRVTGPKPEGWLTRGVGACLLDIGVALAAAGARGKVAREMRLLGGGVALSFAAMNIYDAAVRRRISPVYLLDAAAQLAFAALWGAAEVAEAREARRQPEPAFA